MSAVEAALSGKPLEGFDDELRELAQHRPSDAGFVISERSHADAWAALEAASPVPFLWRAVAVVYPTKLRDAIEGASQALLTDESDPVWLTSGEEIGGHVVTHVAMRDQTIAALPRLAAAFPGAAWTLRADAPDLDAWLKTLGLKIYSEDGR
jgi:hypothetical protein